MHGSLEMALQKDATAFGVESVHDQMRFDSSGDGEEERAGEGRLLILSRPLSPRRAG